MYAAVRARKDDVSNKINVDLAAAIRAIEDQLRPHLNR
jgi:hypothetical protein